MTERKNKVFIATSLDGFIADKNGSIDYLNTIENPENNDMGYVKFIDQIDAIIMGRATYDKVLSFGIDWPYQRPVFVVSNSLKEVPEGYKDKVSIISGSPSRLLEIVHALGHGKLYIDGGQVIQDFLKEDLIDEMTITTIPILLGGGIPLFKDLPMEMRFQHVMTEVFLEEIVQSSYRRKR